MKNIKYLERFSPGTQIFGDIGRVKVILKNGGEINLVDEINSVTFSEGPVSLVIKGRFNYAKFAKNQIAFIGITLGSVVEDESRNRKNVSRGDGKN